jgi:hypothetical protein
MPLLTHAFQPRLPGTVGAVAGVGKRTLFHVTVFDSSAMLTSNGPDVGLDAHSLTLTYSVAHQTPDHRG